MSDIHGNKERFESVMAQISLQPEDILYVLGDVVDRYPDGLRILRKLMAMPNVRMLLGNHEYMMLDALYYNEDYPADWRGQNKYFRLWYSNGGDVTHSYIKHIRKSLRLEIFKYARDDSPYLMIFCRIKKRDESAFLEALRELPNKMLLCGYPDYPAQCHDFMDKIETHRTKERTCSHGEDDAAAKVEQA